MLRRSHSIWLVLVLYLVRTGMSRLSNNVAAPCGHKDWGFVSITCRGYTPIRSADP